jgi:hypothetical protein
MGHLNSRNIVMTVRHYLGHDSMGMCGHLSFSFSIFSTKDTTAPSKVLRMEGSTEKVKVAETQTEWSKALVKSQPYYFLIISPGEFNLWDS